MDWREYKKQVDRGIQPTWLGRKMGPNSVSDGRTWGATVVVVTGETFEPHAL
jgi:hypothetical protein